MRARKWVCGLALAGYCAAGADADRAHGHKFRRNAEAEFEEFVHRHGVKVGIGAIIVGAGIMGEGAMFNDYWHILMGGGTAIFGGGLIFVSKVEPEPHPYSEEARHKREHEAWKEFHRANVLPGRHEIEEARRKRKPLPSWQTLVWSAKNLVKKRRKPFGR